MSNVAMLYKACNLNLQKSLLSFLKHSFSLRASAVKYGRSLWLVTFTFFSSSTKQINTKFRVNPIRELEKQWEERRKEKLWLNNKKKYQVSLRQPKKKSLCITALPFEESLTTYFAIEEEKCYNISWTNQRHWRPQTRKPLKCSILNCASETSVSQRVFLPCACRMEKQMWSPSWRSLTPGATPRRRSPSTTGPSRSRDKTPPQESKPKRTCSTTKETRALLQDWATCPSLDPPSHLWGWNLLPRKSLTRSPSPHF